MSQIWQLNTLWQSKMSHHDAHIHLHTFIYLFYLFGVLRRFQHCIGHITMGSWKGRGNQYIQFVRVLYCKLPTNGKQLPAFPLEAVPGIEPRPQRWEARVLPLCHRGPLHLHTPPNQCPYQCQPSTPYGIQEIAQARF